jgi:hypothetical protein
MAEKCPTCGSSSTLRDKILLIDEAWVSERNLDPRLRYFSDLRVDELRPEVVRTEPMSQFVDGYYCEACGKGFVGNAALGDTWRK